MPSAVEYFDAFAAGVYLLFGSLHLDLGLRRNGRRGHLWLAGASFSALAVDLTGMLLRWQDEPPNRVVAGINFVAVALATTCLFELVATLGRRPAGRVARACAGLAVLAAALAGFAWLPAAEPVLFVTVFVLLGWAMARAVRAVREGDRDVRFVAGGFAVLMVCLILDVLMQLRLLPVVQGLPAIGFIVLFLASAKSLADQGERERRELDGLRRDLERRVEERTVALQEANRQLAEMSRTDALTGLPNRRGFLEACAAELERSRRSGRPFAIVLADVDRFKRVNDTLGHAAGDAALSGIARGIRDALRAQDLVARWGGEEFILLLPETDAAGATQVAEMVRAAIAASPFELAGSTLLLTASFGVAEHRDPTRLEPTIAAADRALYRAKESGRNRVASA